MATQLLRKSLFLRISIYSAFAVFHVNAIASGDNFPPGARAAGMANAGVTACDIWANFNNQACLARIDKPCIGVHHDIRFELKELSTRGMSAAIPSGNGALGICLTSFGYHAYREDKFGISYALKIFKSVYAGIQLEYLQSISSDDIAKSKAFLFELGIMAELGKSIQLGMHLFNPANIHYAGRVEESITPSLTAGLNYKVGKSVILVAETIKSLNSSALYRGGIEFSFAENLFLRTGISGFPLQNSFGTGLKMKKLKLDISVSHHPFLGYSTGCSLHYEIR